MTRAIQLDEIHFDYSGRPVVSGLSLSLDQGEVLALLGPSGCGKTTVLRLILGLMAPTRGALVLGNRLASSGLTIHVPPEKRELAVVFQDLALWPHLTVRGNLEFGLAAKGVARSERQLRIAAMLKRLGLADKASHFPGALSGGERQRVAIARALVLEPQAILLDEPLSNLDIELKHELLALFRRLFQERCSSVIYVTHDLREAATLGDRIAVMESGRIVQLATFEELQGNPATAFVRALIHDLDWHQELRESSRTDRQLGK
jgi:iron(III) transport system ATP-binding protein